MSTPEQSTPQAGTGATAAGRAGAPAATVDPEVLLAL